MALNRFPGSPDRGDGRTNGGYGRESISWKLGQCIRRADVHSLISKKTLRVIM